MTAAASRGVRVRHFLAQKRKQEKRKKAPDLVSIPTINTTVKTLKSRHQYQAWI